MSNDSSFAIRLLRAQSWAGVTQSQLADTMDVKASVVCHYQQGKSLPSYENLVKLAKALNVSTDYLCGLKEQS